VTALNDADKTGIKEVIAAKVGPFCGPNAASACAASDVTITVVRRDATVTYTVAVFTSAAATSGATAIKAVSTTDMTTAVAAKGGNLASASVTAVTATAVSASSEDDSSSTGIIIGVAGAGVAVLGAVGAYFSLCREEPSMTMAKLEDQ